MKESKDFYSMIDGKTLCDYRDYLYQQMHDITTQLMYINMELEKRLWKVIKEQPIEDELKPTDTYIKVKKKEWDIS